MLNSNDRRKLAPSQPNRDETGLFFGFQRTAVPTLVNVALRLVPTVVTTVTMAIEIPAAIRPYSMAVAPDSFLRN
jgi:hypothetical protein